MGTSQSLLNEDVLPHLEDGNVNGVKRWLAVGAAADEKSQTKAMHNPNGLMQVDKDADDLKARGVLSPLMHIVARNTKGTDEQIAAIMQALVDGGGNPELEFDGLCPLHVAVDAVNLPAARVLLEEGVNCNRKKAVMTETEPRTLLSNDTPLTALLKIKDRKPTVELEKLRRLLISKGAKTNEELESGSRVWANRRESVEQNFAKQRKMKRVIKMGRLTKEYVNRHRGTDVLPEESKKLERLHLLVEACEEATAVFLTRGTPAEKLDEHLEGVRLLGAPPDEVVEVLKQALEGGETLDFLHVDDVEEDLPPLPLLEPMPLTARVGGNRPSVNDANYSAILGGDDMDAAEYLLEFAEMKVTPAPAEVLACFQKLDDDSLSMDIHRNCVKALDLVCHESKPLLEPLVVRGGAIPTITRALQTKDDHEVRVFGSRLLLNLLGVKHYAGSKRSLRLREIAHRTGGYDAVISILEKETQLGIDARAAGQIDHAHEPVLSRAIGILMKLMDSDDFALRISQSTGGRLHDAVSKALAANSDNHTFAEFAKKAMELTSQLATNLPALNEGKDYHTDQNSMAAQRNARLLDSLRDEAAAADAEVYALRPLAIETVQHLHKHWEREETVGSGLEACVRLLGLPVAEELREALIGAGLVRALVRIFAAHAQKTRYFGSTSANGRSFKLQTCQMLSTLVFSLPDERAAAISIDLADEKGAGQTPGHSSLLAALIVVINEAPEDEVAFKPAFELLYMLVQTAQFDSLVAPSLAEKVRWAAHTAMARRSTNRWARGKGAAIVDTIAERFEPWSAEPWILNRSDQAREGRLARADSAAALKRLAEAKVRAESAARAKIGEFSDEMHEGAPQYEPSMCLFSLVDSWVSVEGLGIGKVVKFEKVSKVNLLGNNSMHTIDFSLFWDGNPSKELNARNVQKKEVLLRRLKGEKYNAGRRFQILTPEELQLMGSEGSEKVDAIDGTDPEALHELAYTFLQRGDPESAISYWLKAAGLGHAKSQYELGLAYSKGDGIPIALEEARSWYEKAANQGHSRAQHNLGNMYRHGRGVKKSNKKAIAWWTKASNQGLAETQYNLAYMYEKGKGTPKDMSAAATLYEAAAAGGLVHAQFTIAGMYDKGRGVVQNYSAAQKWYQAAAEQGHSDAIEHLNARTERWMRRNQLHDTKRPSSLKSMFSLKKGKKPFQSVPAIVDDGGEEEDEDEDEDEGKSGDGAGSGLGGGVAGGRAGREPSGEAASGDADNPVEETISVAQHVKKIQDYMMKIAVLEMEKKATDGIRHSLVNGDGERDSTNDGERSSQYTSWLKQRMLQKESGMDDEELNWEFRVFTKEVENSYLYAQEKEHEAQHAYGRVMGDKDVFDKLIRLLKNNPAIDALEQVSVAREDDEGAVQSAVLSQGGPETAQTVAGGPTIKLKDDPMYAKYFKMLKMHLPPPAVKQKMTADGLDSSILDSDPEGPSPNQATGAPKKQERPPMDMFAQIRAAKAQKEAAGAAGGGGKKEVSMKAAMLKVDKVLNGRRGAKEELGNMTYPEGDRRFEVCVTCLEQIVDAHCTGGAAAAKKAAETELEAMRAAQREYQSRSAAKKKEADLLDKSIEKWARRKEKAPEREAMEKVIELKWASDHEEANNAALALTRSFMPVDIKALGDEEIVRRARLRAGEFYPRSLASRLRSKKMLHWVVTHPEDIKTANFLQGAERNEFLNIHEYVDFPFVADGKRITSL
jgi:TPR repeat protein